MKLKQLWYRFLKRFYLYIYQRPILRDLAERKGECKQCGYCCEQDKCPLLSYDKDGKAVCKVHGTMAKPIGCIIAPIRLDFKMGVMSEKCGYYYPEMIKDGSNNKT